MLMEEPDGRGGTAGQEQEETKCWAGTSRKRKGCDLNTG